MAKRLTGPVFFRLGNEARELPFEIEHRMHFRVGGSSLPAMKSEAWIGCRDRPRPSPREGTPLVLQDAADGGLQETRGKIVLSSFASDYGSAPVQPDTGAAVADEFERLDMVLEGRKHSAAFDDLEAALIGEADLETLAHPRNRSVVQ